MLSHADSQRHFDDEDLATQSAQERRASCRYPVVGVEAVLSWWEPITASAAVRSAPKGDSKPAGDQTIYGRVMARSPGGHNGTTSARATAELARDVMPPIAESMRSHTIGARLLDISQTGVLVLSAKVPPIDRRIWLRLESPQITDWVEVELKGASAADPETHQVRLAFRESCPYDFFKTVLYKKPRS